MPPGILPNILFAVGMALMTNGHEPPSPPLPSLSPTITATPTTTPSPTPTHTTRIIEKGETIRGIAKEHYGSELYWKLIWNDNPELTDPQAVHQGLKIILRTHTPEEPEALLDNLQKRLDEINKGEEDEDVNGAATSSAIHASPTPTPVVEAQVASGGSFDAVYKDAGSKYGIPWQILHAIHMIETGGRDGAITSGYGTGAQGPMQFMPGTWNAYGVDGNGDGNVDINNAHDAIHAAANYLQRHGELESGLKSYGIPVQRVFDLAHQYGFTR